MPIRVQTGGRRWPSGWPACQPTQTLENEASLDADEKKHAGTPHGQEVGAEEKGPPPNAKAPGPGDGGQDGRRNAEAAAPGGRLSWI